MTEITSIANDYRKTIVELIDMLYNIVDNKDDKYDIDKLKKQLYTYNSVMGSAEPLIQLTANYIVMFHVEIINRDEAFLFNFDPNKYLSNLDNESVALIHSILARIKRYCNLLSYDEKTIIYQKVLLMLILSSKYLKVKSA